MRELAAGFVIGLLAAGAAAWLALGVPRGEDSDWRAAVVDYMGLYTNETFASVNPDRETQAKELGAVGRQVGADLTPENAAMPGLDFKVAFILAFDGAPLGEIAYVDPTGAPVLFCVIANGAADAPLRSEKRGEFALAYMDPQRARLSGDRPSAGTAGRRAGAHARGALLTARRSRRIAAPSRLLTIRTRGGNGHAAWAFSIREDRLSRRDACRRG